MRNFKPTTQQHRPKKSALIIGQKKVIEAMNAGEQIERIYLANTVHGKLADEIRKIAEDHLIPVNKVPVEKINSFNIDDHDG